MHGEYDERKAFKAYKLYLAIQQHFKRDSYDFFKYKGEVSAKLETFQKRNDRYFFFKLSKKYGKDEDLIYFLVSNFMAKDASIWIGDLLKPEYDAVYMSYKKRNESLGYTFQQDCEKVLDRAYDNSIQFNTIFKPVDNQHPLIVKMVLKGEINIETFIILDKILGCINDIDKNLDEPYAWGRLKRKCDKYKNFVHIDVKDYKPKLKALLSNYYELSG